MPTTSSSTYPSRATSTEPETEDAATIREPEPQPVFDIEHMPVTNDPRQWSPFRKNFVLLQVAFGSMIAGLAANIQNPSIAQMEADLPATPGQISLSMSLFILFQGGGPLVWSAISEVKGRKIVYVVSLAIFTVGSIVVATSKTIGLVIGFRCLQAAGSSAVMSIGAATLADIFDPAERGRKMGIYYIAPLLGPSIGSILGGGLTTAFTWRGPFYFLAIVSGVVMLSFLLFFKDTFRRERSITYQNALKARLREGKLNKSDLTIEKKIPSGEVETNAANSEVVADGKEIDVEKQSAQAVVNPGAISEMKLTLMDVNPLKPMIIVIRRVHNLAMLVASGLLFAFAFVIVYTSSRTLGTFYNYSPLKIGLVLLSYGIGSIAGSILGGAWSDYQLARLKAKNGGKSYPEMRLRSTIHGIVIFPLCVVGFAWVSQEHVNIAGVCVMLFACGFFSIFVYSSTLAYIVDSNVGRSSTAVALNSAFRGLFAFIFEEIAVPMQDGLGDGWMYTIIAFMMVLSGGLIVLVMYKGEKWRAMAEAREAREAEST